MDSFEELWNACEQFHKNDSPNESVIGLIEKLELKIELYKAIEVHSMSLVVEDKQKAKSRLFGEILFSLAQLSLIDDINIFDALQISLEEMKNQF
jgi:hypothetical protein